jgi:hypothetical protein
MLDLTLGKEEAATMSRFTTGLHWLPGRSLWQVQWSVFMSCSLVLFSQLVMAMVPHMFSSLSHLVMLSPSQVNALFLSHAQARSPFGRQQDSLFMFECNRDPSVIALLFALSFEGDKIGSDSRSTVCLREL